MKARIVFATAATLMCAAAVLFVLYDRISLVPDPFSHPNPDRSEGPAPVPTYLPIDTSHFLDLPRFFAVANLEAPALPFPGKVVAGVVNHHVLAVDLLERFAKGLQAARPDTKRIIILSPDHFQAGRSAISIHLRPYQTPFGLVPIDDEAVLRLAESGAAMNMGPMFEQEHGVGALIPFLHRSFPDMQVVPLAIRGQTDQETLIRLGRVLSSFLDEHTLIVVSADMSHYLPEETALKNDEQTLHWLQALDVKAFDMATDDFVDNGSSFVVLSQVFQELRQKPKFTLFDHTISTHYGGARDNTTSYMTGVWSVSQ